MWPGSAELSLRNTAQGCSAVSGRIVVVFGGKFGEFFCNPLAGVESGVGPGDALCAVFVSRERAKLLEFSYGAFEIQAHLCSTSCDAG